VDMSGNIINFTQIATSDFFNTVPGKIAVGSGVVFATIQPEDLGFGAGFISTTGATLLSSGQPFAFSCTVANTPNIKIQTNYLLTATNNPYPNGTNYVRILDTIVDGGTWGTGNTVNPIANPSPSFAVGASMCPGGKAATGFSFPASGMFIPATQGISQTGTIQNSNSGVINNQLQAGSNKLSSGGIAGIVIAVIIIVAIGGIAVAFFVYKKRNGTLSFSFGSSYQSQSTDLVQVPAPIPFVSKPLPPSPILFTVGTKVIAKYSGDGKEYRGIIDEVRPGPQYLVRYLDFGNDKEWLPVSCVRAG